MLSCENLEELELDATNVSDESFAHIAQTCPNLQTLLLDGSTELRNIGPISCLKSLTVLSLRQCEIIQDVTPLAALRQLTVLNLQRVHSVTGKVGFWKMVHFFPFTFIAARVP